MGGARHLINAQQQQKNMNPSRRLSRRLGLPLKKKFKKAWPIVKASGPDRDAEIERRADHEAGRIIFGSWIKRFKGIAKTPDEVAESFIDLMNEVTEKLSNKERIDFVVKEVIWPCVQRWHELTQILDNVPVKISALCVCHTVHQTVVPMSAWMSKGFTLECDSCGYEIKAEDCAEWKPRKKKN